MILIIHGSDIEKSRNYFFAEKEKIENYTLVNPDDATFDLLFLYSENKNFLNKSTTIIFENFFSKIKPTSKEFKDIYSYINKNKQIDLIFWEDSEISKTALSAFNNATVKNFSLPQHMFVFLDNIKPNNSKNSIKLFHELLKTTETEIIFFMIIRQFRLLISQMDIKGDLIDEAKRLAPWQLSKYKNQASYFEKYKIVKSYEKLFVLDLANKSGKLPISLEKSIDFFLTDL